MISVVWAGCSLLKKRPRPWSISRSSSFWQKISQDAHWRLSDLTEEMSLYQENLVNFVKTKESEEDLQLPSHPNGMGWQWGRISQSQKWKDACWGAKTCQIVLGWSSINCCLCLKYLSDSCTEEHDTISSLERVQTYYKTLKSVWFNCIHIDTLSKAAEVWCQVRKVYSN